MSQEIEKLAYLLWEQAGRPYCDDNRFWLQAEEQLSVTAQSVPVVDRPKCHPDVVEYLNQPENWKISSGVLEVEGAGDPQEMVDVFLKHAHAKNQQLGETVVATCSNKQWEFDTIPNLRRLGLWN